MKTTDELIDVLIDELTDDLSNVTILYNENSEL